MQSHIISDNQFGFRKNTTSMALINLTDKKQMELAITHLTCVFDTIVHNMLLQKLSCYGIKGHILSWCKSYLDNRNHHVPYNSVDSTSTIMNFCLFTDGTSLFLSNKKFTPV